MKKQYTIIALIITGILIGGALILSGNSASTPRGASKPALSVGDLPATGIATMENGIQYVDITAYGGYSPGVTIAQAGVETVIRMKTRNTFDCSSALVIPSLGFSGYLERTGTKEIPVPADKAQGTLEGLCSMGMYTFSITFE